MASRDIEVEGVTAHKATARLIRAALIIWQADPHQISTRPCSTCEALTEILGERYGCRELRDRK